MRKLGFVLLFPILITTVLATEPVMANVTYYYTGNPFNSGDMSSIITAQITFDDTITSSFTGTIQLPQWGPNFEHVISITISYGGYTINWVNGNTDPTIWLAAFGPFNFVNGHITRWGISLYDQIYPNVDSLNLHTEAILVGDVSGVTTTTGYDATRIPILNPPADESGSIYNNPGAWTLTNPSSPPSSAAPVPALTPVTMLLLVAGLAGLVAYKRKIKT